MVGLEAVSFVVNQGLNFGQLRQHLLQVENCRREQDFDTLIKTENPGVMRLSLDSSSEVFLLLSDKWNQ